MATENPVRSPSPSGASVTDVAVVRRSDVVDVVRIVVVVATVTVVCVVGRLDGRSQRHRMPVTVMATRV
jgi:hypothetical protein